MPKKDLTDTLYSLGQKLEIYHAPSQKSISFKAYIETFEDDYGAKWNSESVFGRNDPHHVFKNLERVINLQWALPAYSFEEGRENLKKLSALVNMQYPVYDGDAGTNSRNLPSATAISASPIFRVKFMNLIQDVSATSIDNSHGTAKNSGLLGIMLQGIKFSPNLEYGLFVDNEKNKIYPKVFTLSFTYGVLHTHKLGWRNDNIRQKGFPYGEDLTTANDQRDAINSVSDQKNTTDEQQQQGNEPPKTVPKNKTNKQREAARKQTTGGGFVGGFGANPVNGQ